VSVIPNQLVILVFGLSPLWVCLAVACGVAASAVFKWAKQTGEDRATLLRPLIKFGHAPTPIETKRSDGSRATFCELCGECLMWRVPHKVPPLLTHEGKAQCAGREGD